MKIKALAVAVMLAAAGSANAAIHPGTVGTNTLGTEMFVTVFDPSAQMSYALDLGIYGWDMVDNAATPLSFNLGADADFAAFVGQTDLRFTVTTTYRNLDTYEDAQHFGLITTSASAPNVFLDTRPFFGDIDMMSARVSSMAQNLNANAVNTGQPNNAQNNYAVNNSSVALIGQMGYYYVPTWNDTLGGAGYDASGDVGTAVNFYHFGLDADLMFNDAIELTTATLLGSWNLDTSGMLTYSAAGGTNPVPVPAAAWLFGSGLLGLVGVARRKAA